MPRAWLAVLEAAALVVGVLNLQRPLANPDEGRYSEISREMVASGDWVTPRLDGIKYFEKPPLQYWASAAAFGIFGTNEPAARLYGWLAGFLTLVVVGFAAWRLAGAAVAGASVLANACCAVGAATSAPAMARAGAAFPACCATFSTCEGLACRPLRLIRTGRRSLCPAVIFSPG